jgi:TolA-binding protein
MEFERNRRRFLELAGPTAAAALAGCGSLTSSSQDGTETVTETDTAADAQTRTVAVSVEPDQQALQQRQSEIRSELQSGNINRSQAQQQFRRAQNELRAEAVESFRQRAQSTSGLSVEDAIDQFSLLLIAGPATTLIDTLSMDGVVGLLPPATFEEARSQAGAGTESGSGAGTESGSEAGTEAGTSSD